MTKPSSIKIIGIITSVILSCLLISASTASALTPLPEPDPKPGGFGLEATKPKDPPSRGASITTPGNGGSFSDSPIAVRGICPDGLLVQLYNNGVMVGSVMCQGGSFSLEVSLFAGTNELSALVFDEIDQQGPESNVVTVNYTDTRFTAFGQLLTLTSSYGRRSAAASTQLNWPLQLSGGTGPYAFSIDWGDGSDLQLLSQPVTGALNLSHVYERAGIYQVNVRATDINGVSAFLQLIAVSNGKVEAVDATEQTTDGKTQERVTILWVPAVVALILLLPTYWLGRRSQLISLRNKMEKERDSYQEK